MNEFFEHINHWHWFALGLIFIVTEIFASGTVILWLGLAAFSVGLVVWLLPEIAWETQFILYAAAAFGATFTWWRIQKKHPVETDQPQLNQRTAQYIGRTFTLTEPIVNGRGRIHVDDTYWKIDGDDLPVGAKVKVIGAEGTHLQVECLD